MKNIHILPTRNREISNIGILSGKLHISKIKEFGSNPQHIYITSDEDITIKDYYLAGDDMYQCLSSAELEYLTIDDYCKKIILTTDPILIADGVQPISDEFLQWFVNNSSCEEVEVIFDKFTSFVTAMDVYKIIIPNEEPNYNMKLEILAESERLEEFTFKIPFDWNIKPKEVIDMYMREQENIILTWRLGKFIDMINSLPDGVEKNRILKSVFNNREGELLMESYKSMIKSYEK